MKKKSEKPPYDRALTPNELARRPDSEIDYSDIPALDADFWADVNVKPPRTKPTVSLRLPEEVIAYFKAQNPKGYTGRMAAVLAAYVAARKGEDDQRSL
ncbi:MAG: BrnA antitoxin family protein [Alphaproteobacteria bacterium]|nr:BrnA antitoxin family protein [Alphaproteobacteria bacterium]